MRSNKWTYKASAILLTVLLFISSTGFSYSVHICQGKIESFSLFGDAPACKMAKQEEKLKQAKTCCALKREAEKMKKLEGKDVISKVPCCINKHLFYNTDGEYDSSIKYTTSFDTQTIIAILIPAVQFFSETLDFAWQIDLSPPPLLHRDLSVLYQVFRL